MTKTLLIYYSADEAVRTLCEDSRKYGEIDVVELTEAYDRSRLEVATLGAVQALAGKSSVIDKTDIDFDAYDTVILASPVWAASPAPAINAFLRRTDLRSREIIGLLFGGGRASVIAGDMLRKRTALAGGICRSIVSVPPKELKKDTVDLFSLLKTKAPAAALA
ncbi:MAG: hypothetical protein GX851_02595 [Clostridiales bacterium]|nr:hypothetical protein [Clostridiales bacterium]